MSFGPNEVDNPFPRPPERFRLFTDLNVALLKTLRERSGTQVHEPLPEGQSQEAILEGENLEGVPEDLAELERPRVDWVVEGGHFEVFEVWTDIVDGNPRVPPEEMVSTILKEPEGGKDLRLYIRPYLKKLLRTILHSYYTLLGGTTEHLPVDDAVVTVFDVESTFISEISRAFLSTVNSIRPLQARQTLEQLLIRQLETRRAETRKIHEKCDSIEATLALLKAKAAEVQQQQVEGLEKLTLNDSGSKPSKDEHPGEGITDDDVLQWANELIEENKIPEFDNLYLDFNSIIHNCSHPNDNDAHFRLSEAQIFTAIFAYVDHLFSKIKPKKVFFMAVDGVAPRAKMNQQRSRRFRTAKEAKETREQALRRGEKLPEEKAFDSNCITPGTPFMARLSEQLKYFVNKKISEDSDWRGIQVILSGHEVPGEGEHKIMEYIRLSKAQPDYNPNVRHCLYGLDADLIMLGLLSHDPHFCLLREEVKFGPARKKATSLEAQNFFLLHLSLMREYLDLEFHSLLELPPGELPFDYSLERIIDDFVLLAIFIGNDFLPHLPDFHIHENALEHLFDIYKAILPKAGGYLLTQGTINMRRLQL
ncbi:hypothetical protein FRB90_007374, partial [Tulasnella sp. 427]